MTNKHIIEGCEFQSYCIEYKDISYLKIMPICAIHELSIACHDKENKCKYYKLYKQLKRKEEEHKELRRSILKIFTCLIKANRANKIIDTLWLDDITTLWDYIAQILEIEGDQTQIEEQILQKITEKES